MDSKHDAQERRMRVLVVDDDPAIRLLLDRFLDQENCEVETAPDGEIALEFFQAGHFDVLMVDYQLPGMTGLDVMEMVRQQNPRIPIALITGVAYALEGIDLQQAGVTQLFTKPFDLYDIADWLRSLPS